MKPKVSSGKPESVLPTRSIVGELNQRFGRIKKQDIGIQRVRQDSLGNFFKILFGKGNAYDSPRLEVGKVFEQGRILPLLEREILINPLTRRTLIHEALRCILDINTGHGNAWGISVRNTERNIAIEGVWKGLQKSMASVAGGDLDLLTQMMCEFVEETTRFVTALPQFVPEEQAKALNLPLMGEKEVADVDIEKIKNMTRQTFGDSFRNDELDNVNSLFAGAEKIDEGEKDEDTGKKITAQFEEFPDTTFVMVKPMYPLDIQLKNAEYVLTILANVITNDPIAEELVRRVAGNKEAKRKTQFQPVWTTLAHSLKYVKRRIIGNWFANERPVTEVPRAAVVMMGWAVTNNDATRLAEEVTAENHKAVDEVLDAQILKTEFLSGKITDKNDDVATQFLREYAMQMFVGISRAGFIETLVSVLGNKKITGDKDHGGIDWLNELAKVLRDVDYQTTYQNKANLEVGDDMPLGHVYMNQMDTEDVAVVGDDGLRDTLAGVLCGTLGPAPRVDGMRILRLDLASLLLLQNRSTGNPGRPLAMMTEATTDPAQRKRISDLYLNEVNNLGASLIPQANSADTTVDSRSNGLNYQQRVSFLINLWVHNLSQRPNEPMDDLKDRARENFIGFMLYNFNNPSQSQLINDSVNQAIRVIGLRWPEKFSELVIRTQNSRKEYQGAKARLKTKKLVGLLAVVEDDLVVNLGRAGTTTKLSKQETSGRARKELVNTKSNLTQARTPIVAGESEFLGKIEKYTQDWSTPDRTSMRRSVMGELMNLNEMYELAQLSSSGSNEAIITLAYALQQYFHEEKITESNRGIMNAISNILGIAKSAGIKHKIPESRLGNDRGFNYARMVEINEGIGISFDRNDVLTIINRANDIFALAPNIVKTSLDIVDALALSPERMVISERIGAQLSEQLGVILRNHPQAPVDYSRLIAALEERTNTITGRVQVASKSLLGATGLFDMGEDFEKTLHGIIEHAKEGEAAKLSQYVQNESQKTRDELSGQLDKTYNKSFGKVFEATKSREELMMLLLSEALRPYTGGDSVAVEKFYREAIRKYPKGSKEPIQRMAQLMKSAYSIFGFGNSVLVQDNRDRGIKAAADMSLEATAPLETIASAQSQVNARTSEIEAKTVLGSLDDVYKAKLQLFTRIAEQAAQVDNIKFDNALEVQKQILLRQYTQARLAVGQVFDVADQLVRIRTEGIGLEVREAESALNYMKEYMDVIRPIVRNIMRMLKYQWGLDVSPAMGDWENPEKIIAVALKIDPKKITGVRVRKEKQAKNLEVDKGDRSDENVGTE